MFLEITGPVTLKDKEEGQMMYLVDTNAHHVFPSVEALHTFLRHRQSYRKWTPYNPMYDVENDGVITI